MIALDMDGTLLATDGAVSARNRAALRAAEAAGMEVVIATGRRHCYAMRQLRTLGLRESGVLVSSNGAVMRTLAHTLLERSLMTRTASERLFAQLGEFRNALVVTFDCVGENGEDARGALVVEDLEELHGSIGRWMAANEPYIAHERPIERSLERGEPIQMMLCGTVERMRRAEALLRTMPGVRAVGETHADDDVEAEIALHRTEYPERDLSIVDILPAGASKGAALKRLAKSRGAGMGELMAIGDNWNDLPMLEVAGWPVLMGNAPQELRAMARARGWSVVGTNDADGVAEAIEAVLARGAAGAVDEGAMAEAAEVR